MSGSFDCVTPNERRRASRLVVSNHSDPVFEAFFYCVVNQLGLIVENFNSASVEDHLVAKNLNFVSAKQLTFASTSTLINMAVQWLKLILLDFTVARVALPCM